MAKIGFLIGCALLVAITKVERSSQVESEAYRIGIDLMGSEHSPETFLTALKATSFPKNVEIVILGSQELEAYSSFTFYSSQEFVTMDDNPLAAYRKKKSASMFLGLRLLKQKKIDAFISSGNTGALVLGSKLILSSLSNISRPAFLSLIPTRKNPVAILDLGANVQCKASHLVQFAYMAVAYLKAHGIKKPKIGLLNIGEESIKGTSELRLAYSQLQMEAGKSFQFAGNVEGKSAFDGEVDALITDGFTGNVFLKTAEGIANLILDRIRHNLPESTFEAVNPQMKDLQKHLHYAEYPGALLIGVDGIVTKCHGYSTPKALINAIFGVIELSKRNFLHTFKEILYHLYS